MTKYILCLLIVCFASLQTQAVETTTITGKIINPKGDQLRIRYIKPALSNELIDFETPLKENGEFEIELQISQPCIVDLNQNRRIIQVYIEPNDQLHIEFNRADLNQLPTLSGQGSENNKFFTALNLEEPHIFRINYKNLNANAFRQMVDQRRQTRLRFLAENREKYQLTNSFLDYCLAEINYEWALVLFEYPQNFLFNNGRMPSLPSDYFNFIHNTELNDESAIISPRHNLFLTAYFNKIIREQIVPKLRDKQPTPEEAKRLTSTVFQYDLANEHLKEKVRYFFQSGVIVKAYQSGAQEVAEEIFSNFKQHNPYPEYTKEIETIRQNALSLSSGQPAPNFTLTDIDGNKVSLQDFQGSMVFLDFWASWCAPCIGNLPYIEMIREKTKDAKIVFLNISLDENPNAWKNMIQQKNIKGIHLRAKGWQSDIAKSYNVRALPSYFLIAPNGNLAERIIRLSNTDKITNLILELSLQN